MKKAFAAIVVVLLAILCFNTAPKDIAFDIAFRQTEFLSIPSAPTPSIYDAIGTTLKVQFPYVRIGRGEYFHYEDHTAYNSLTACIPGYFDSLPPGSMGDAMRKDKHMYKGRS